MYTHRQGKLSFWDFIADLHWCDRSECKLDTRPIGNMIRSLPPAIYEEFLSEYMNALSDICPLVPACPDPESVAAHIIARGRDYFVAAKKDPRLIERLINSREYQDFSRCFLES